MKTQPKISKSKPQIADKRVDAKPVRVGIVGAGLMGKWHAHAAAKMGGNIVGIVDLNKVQSVLLATKYPSAQVFGTIAEMLNQTPLDVLHICVPTANHRLIAELAIDVGVNLIIEKPLTTTSAETINLYNLAKKKGVYICPVHQFAFQLGVEKAKKLLPRIGQIIHLQATMCSAGGTDLPDYKLDLIAADMLPHPLSLFQVFLNNILPVEGWKFFQPRHGEIRVAGHSGEISLSIFVSMNGRPTTNSFQIIGTIGTIHLNLFHGSAFIETGEASRGQKIMQPFGFSLKIFSSAAFNLICRAFRFEPAYPGLQQLIKCYYESIRENLEPPISSRQAINIAKVRDLLISYAENRSE